MVPQLVLHSADVVPQFFS